MRFALVIAAALSAAPLSAAPVCEMRGAEELEVLEAAKAEFLKGDFEKFADVATEVMGNSRATLDKPIAQMAGLFPMGFESCQTVLQRREAGGMVQEVSTFNIKDGDFPMSLYLAATPIRGEWKIVHLNFDTSFTKVLSGLR